VTTLRQNGVGVEAAAELEISDELGISAGDDGVGIMGESVVVDEIFEDYTGVDEKSLFDSDKDVTIVADGVEEITSEELGRTEVEQSVAVWVEEAEADEVND
jgi:hypothetical protein